MATLYPAQDQFVHLSQLVAEPAHWRAVSEDANDWEHTVADFTGRLRQLYGLPFKYLVPDDSMLPPESIRFFYVDQNWINALSDGALSLGRIGASDLQHDQAMAPVLARRAEQTTLNLRRHRLALPARAEAESEPVYCGFLLRSAVVSGWPGLEVRASKASTGSGVNTRCTGDQVELVRMDRLSADVLLCLFGERFACVQIHEPKEGVNYGAAPELPAGTTAADQVDPVLYRKQLRGLGIGPYPVAEFIQDAEVEVPLRSQSSRVVEIAQLRLDMISKLRALDPPAWQWDDSSFTSAQFALEMVEGASQHIFRTEDETPPVALEQPRRTPLAELRAADRAQLNSFLFGAPDTNEGEGRS